MKDVYDYIRSGRKSRVVIDEMDVDDYDSCPKNNPCQHHDVGLPISGVFTINNTGKENRGKKTKKGSKGVHGNKRKGFQGKSHKGTKKT